MRFFPFMLLMVTIFIASALIFGGIFLYGWLWALVSPLSLWQIIILLSVVSAPLIFRLGDIAVSERVNPFLHLLIGPPFIVGIAMLFGWITSKIVDIGLWPGTLFSIVIITTVFYTALRLADKAVEKFGPIEEWGIEEDDDDYDLDPEEYELHDRDIERVIWLANKNNKSRKGRRKRR